MNFLLPETLLEAFAIALPPLTIEDLGHDFDHDHLVALDVVFGALPGTGRGTTGVRRHAAKRLRQLGAHLRKHVRRHVGPVTKVDGQQDLDQVPGHGSSSRSKSADGRMSAFTTFCISRNAASFSSRSEEHTSELQSRLHLVCRLLLEKKQ